MRWVGFDPTNNTAAGERHIPVAIGRDYSDVPPSRAYDLTMRYAADQLGFSWDS